MATDTQCLDQVLFYERRGHVALATLNRPEVRNAIDGRLANAIEEVVRRTEADDGVRAVVLASAVDSVFCAGADLSEISRGNGHRLITKDGGFAGIARAQRSKPWIAAVNGAAFAGGCELVLACDLVVAGTSARFAVPEVKRGLFAAGGAPLRLMRTLPHNIALEMLATGDPIGAERAYALGLVNRLCEPEAVIDVAMELAGAIASNAPVAVRETMAIARGADRMDEAAFWARSDEVKDVVFASEDAREGPRAFLEKRQPVWTGR